jgi:diaminohydroxyphosphoribosylaminopyrimidine deaminase / 5-amino-6-(5-phosphoribosylamino)uracil reductase
MAVVKSSLSPVDDQDSIDGFWMRRALDLAQRGEGLTSPNPMVGAVLVLNGKIVGEGYHAFAGADHAEQMAIREAGSLARGATLYVSLEPCNHHGRTPPCTEAILTAGITGVCYAVGDSNSEVSGGGACRLEQAGLVVRAGVLESEARHQNRFYFCYHSSGRPFVVAKYATSLDGKIATRAGESRWISGSAARRRVHELRSTVDAVVMGTGTLVADDPLMSVRHGVTGGRQPVRIALDAHARIPLSARLFASGSLGRIIVVSNQFTSASHRRGLESKGVEVVNLQQDDGLIDLNLFLDLLGERGIQSLLVEGGARLLGSFFDMKAIDEVFAFVAPIIIGGTSAPGPIGGTGVGALRSATRMSNIEWEQMGDDLLFHGYINHTSDSPKSHVHGYH